MNLAVRVLLVMLSVLAGWAIGSVLGLVILAFIANALEQPLNPWVTNATLALGWVGGISGLLLGLRLTRRR